MVYYGTVNNTLHYFAKLGMYTMIQSSYWHVMVMCFSYVGYHCEEHDNPADFVLDVINQCEGNKSAATSEEDIMHIFTSTVYSVSSIDLLAIEQGDNNDVVDLSQAYKQSDERNDINAQCENIVANLNGKEDVGYKIRPVKAKYVTNPFWQVII